MTNDTYNDLMHEVIVNGRENGISYALFRNAIGKKMGINSTAFTCLDLLFYRGISNPSELAKYTGLSSGSTTAMLDRLEKMGLIQRQPNPHDRRGTLIVVDKLGAKKFSPLFASAREAQDALLNSFSPPELQTVSRYFKTSAAIFDSQRQLLEAD